MLPIFYDVSPSDVRNQTGRFAAQFKKYEERYKDEPEKVLRWRAALTEVANLSGWDSKGRYACHALLSSFLCMCFSFPFHWKYMASFFFLPNDLKEGRRLSYSIYTTTKVGYNHHSEWCVLSQKTPLIGVKLRAIATLRLLFSKWWFLPPRQSLKHVTNSISVLICETYHSNWWLLQLIIFCLSYSPMLDIGGFII